MARILMANVPAYGLANPSLPLVRALVDAGHDVDYLLPESFRRPVESLGATLIPYAFYLDGPITRPRQLARFGRRLFRDMAAGMRRLGPRYDAVIGAGIQPELPSVERELDCPVLYCSPVFLQNDRTLRHFAAISTGLPGPIRRGMRTPALRRALGAAIGAVVVGRPLGDVVDLLGPRSTVLNLCPASRYHQPFDSDFGDNCLFMGPTPTLSVPDDTFPLDRLRQHPGPVIYATLGTVFNSWTDYFRILADAFGDSDALLVLTTGNPASLDKVGPVPGNVILRSFVPQADVLAEADLCFTHGGFGSATDAVALGARAILTPLGADQYFNAYRLQELRAGRVLPKSDVTVDNVRRVADEVLADAELAAGMARLRSSFAEAGGPQAAVRAIEAALT